MSSSFVYSSDLGFRHTLLMCNTYVPRLAKIAMQSLHFNTMYKKI